MTLAFVTMLSQALLLYKFRAATPKSVAWLHGALHVVAFALSVAGLAVSVNFKVVLGSRHFFSVHSWVGIVTMFCYFCHIIVSIGFAWKPKYFSCFVNARESFLRIILPNHTLIGLAIYVAGILSVVTGLLERQGLYSQATKIDPSFTQNAYYLSDMSALAVMMLFFAVYYQHRKTKVSNSLPDEYEDDEDALYAPSDDSFTPERIGVSGFDQRHQPLMSDLENMENE